MSRWNRRERLTQQERAPLCSWPSGCRRRTWDLSGRCPQHRHEPPPNLAGAVTGQPADGGFATPPDPFDVPLSPAAQLREVADRLTEREAVALANAGVTAGDWDAWDAAAGGWQQADTILAAVKSGIGVEDLPRFTGEHTPSLRDYTTWGRWSEPERRFDGPAVVAWLAAEPGINSYSVRQLIDYGWAPDTPRYLQYRTAGLPAGEALYWDRSGVEPADAAVWWSAGVRHDDAAVLQGTFEQDPATFAAAAATVPDDYLPRAGAAARVPLWAAGVTPDDYKDYSKAVSDPVAVGQMARLGMTATDYRRWRRGPGGPSGANLDAAQIAAAVHHGVTIDDAVVYWRHDVPYNEWAAAARDGAVGDNIEARLADRPATAAFVAKSENAPPESLDRIVRGVGGQAAVTALQNPRCPTGTLSWAAANSPADGPWLDAAACNPNCPPDALVLAAASPDDNTRWRAARHLNTPPEALTALAADPHPRIRDNAAVNPNLPAAGKAAGGLFAD